MPILVEPPFTSEQETRVKALIAEAIEQFKASPSGYTDVTGQPVTVRQALHRGPWMYDQRGRLVALEKAVHIDAADDQLVADRVTQVEAGLAANTTADAAEAAEQDQIRAALGKPILP